MFFSTSLVKSFLKFQKTLKLGFPAGSSWDNPLIENNKITIEELNDLEEGIIKGTGKLIGSAAKGVGKLALGTVKLAGKGIMAGGKAVSYTHLTLPTKA